MGVSTPEEGVPPSQRSSAKGRATRARTILARAIHNRSGPWRGFADWLRVSSTGLLPLALLVGAGAGGGAVLFRYLILWFTELFTGRSDFSGAGHVASPHFPGLGVFFVVLVPVIGGLIYGPIVDRFAKEARGHGVPEVMLAVAERGGRIRPAVAAVKALASALCIGSGGSVGREGPIVQIGSALGSSAGQLLHLPETRLRLLVACGAAGGIAATFNAPIAGVFFALELILRDFAVESFGAVVLASVMASVIGRSAFGNHPFLALPTFHVVSPAEFGLYAVLGLVTALAGVAFTRVLYGIEDLFDWLWRWSEAWRPAAGGVLLGLVLLALPEMYGVGYPVLERAVTAHYVAWFLLVLFAAKVATTSLTIGIGGSGGVFAPSLFMGATLGTAYGIGVHHLFPGATAPAGAYGLVAMGGVFAGAARAPITAVLIVFELTGEYQIVLPLMVTVVVAASASALVSRDTIYTLKLRRRGIDIRQGRQANLMELLTVADAMGPVPSPISISDTIGQVIDRLAGEHADALPVVDDTASYRGTVTAKEVEAAARANLIDATAGELVHGAEYLVAGQSLESALGTLVAHEQSGLPVVGDGGQLVGWLTHRDVLGAYSARLRSSARQVADRSDLSVPSTGQRISRGASVDVELRDFRVVELELNTSAPPVGSTVAEVRWPPSSLLLAVRRAGSTIQPDDRTLLAQGDRLTVLVRSDHADEIAELISASRRSSAFIGRPS
jgi:chloride channel protein, CIC family